MARSQETFSKKEKEKKRRKKRLEKQEKMAARKAAAADGNGPGDMMAYIDENGNIVDEPPDPLKKKKVIADNIVLGAAIRERIVIDPIKKGKVDFFNHEKGFGFIRETDTQEKYFVHIHGCEEEITEGDKVQFELERGMKGMNCVRVKKIA